MLVFGDKMTCYIVPTLAALVHFLMRQNGRLGGKHQLWLGQLLLGGTIFGIVDHWWNGELLLLGPDLLKDLALGVVITAVIIGIWAGLVIHDKLTIKSPVSSGP
jgi:hypothetical protein